MTGPVLLSRRTTLRWISAFAALHGGEAAAFAADASPARAIAPVKVGEGYGLDPNLLEPKQFWPRILGPGQLQVIEVVCDFVLPADGSGPSASSVRVHEFIDEWISAPYPIQSADRDLILKGIDWLSAASNVAVTGAAIDQSRIRHEVTRFLEEYRDLKTLAFYMRLRQLIVGGYYTSDIGLSEMGYTGNVPLQSYEGASAEARAWIAKAAQLLGLPEIR